MTKIFYDGAVFGEWDKHPQVVGFTTNTTFASSVVENFKDYKDFAIDALSYTKGRPISFQVVSDDLEDIERDAREISSWGSNVYVKIPIVTANGESALDVIKKLHEEGHKINVTTVYTKEQILSLQPVLTKETPAVVSIFAGGISDTGLMPDEYVTYAVETFSSMKNVEILWAGCQRLLSIKEAERCGCDIITVPQEILKKTNRFDVPLEDASLAKSKLFYSDATKGNLKVNK